MFLSPAVEYGVHVPIHVSNEHEPQALVRELQPPWLFHRGAPPLERHSRVPQLAESFCELRLCRAERLFECCDDFELEFGLEDHVFSSAASHSDPPGYSSCLFIVLSSKRQSCVNDGGVAECALTDCVVDIVYLVHMQLQVRSCSR